MAGAHPLDFPPVTRKREPGGVLLPIGLALLFLGVVLTLAHGKLLWGDEFVTYWIGQRRSMAGIWEALTAGADPNPPLMHILDWWCTSAFGSSALAVRLPSIAGMALALGCLWVFLRRRVAPVFAAAGCLALMTMRGFDYAYDARSYSLLLGFAMAAVLAWSVSVEAGRRVRPVALAALALALGGGISSNYYGVLAFFVVAAGEVQAGVSLRKWRPGAWVAMAAAATPLLGYLRLIRHNVAEFGPHAWNKPRLSMVSDSYLLLVEGVLWPILGLAVYAAWRRKRGRAVASSAFPIWERTAVWALIGCPVLAFLIALGGAGMVSPRCAMSVCAGVAAAGAALLARVASRRAAAWVLVVLTVWVMAREAACGYVLLHQRRAFFQLRDNVERTAAPDEAVVVGDSLVVMPLYWYGSAALREEIVFPVDFDAIHRGEADDSGEQNLWGGRNGVFPVRIDSPRNLLAGREERVYVGPPQGWLARDLVNRGNELREEPNRVMWQNLGGVFTPMAHEQTRVFLSMPAAHP